MNIKKIINESIQGYYLKKGKCSCGCNKCGDKKKLNEFKKRFKKLIRESYLNEETVSTLFKLEGRLVTDTKERNQADIISDIRSISGVTIVSSKEIKNDQSVKDNNSYFSLLSVKIDPHPFIGKGGFGKEQIKVIYDEIKRVTGVKAFKLTRKPQRI